VSFINSNLGSLSFKNFLIYLESAIGIFSQNVAILTLSSLPSNETICLFNFVVTIGGVLSVGYESIILSI
jgi:hypothetical protein